MDSYYFDVSCFAVFCADTYDCESELKFFKLCGLLNACALMCSQLYVVIFETCICWFSGSSMF